MNKKRRHYVFPLIVAVIVVYGFIYLLMQQYIRSSADEIPLQLAENVKAKIESGSPYPYALSGLEPADMQKSLSAYAMVCDSVGTVMISTAMLHGEHPVFPPGVFNHARDKAEIHRTWQPEAGVRSATVILPFIVSGRSGFVVAGRSLRETEKRTEAMKWLACIGAVITIVALLITSHIVKKISTHNEKIS